MIIHWFQFLSAAVILLVPIGLFHGPKVRYRAIRRTWKGYWGRMFTLGQNTADLGRAALGAWLLLESLESDPASNAAFWAVPAVRSAIILVAVVLQMIVCKEHKSINACYPFLIGLMFGLHPFSVACFAVLITVVVAGGARMPMAFYPILAIASLLLGLLMGGSKLNFVMLTGAMACLIPWLSSMMFSRALVYTYRAKRAEAPVPAAV